MGDVVLLVFEGQKPENMISKSLESHYFNETTGSVIRTTFGADIYQLWRKVAEDEFLDLLEVLRESGEQNQEVLRDIIREQVSQIFLFFDYDGHSGAASYEAIQSMLAHFNDESDNGKLYISYPMVEAFRHINPQSDFSETTFDVKHGTRYKEQVHIDCSASFQDVRNFEKSHWNHILLENYKKANLIVHGSYEKPEFKRLIETLRQEHIFNGQLEKYISPLGKVAVLSSFPFFIIEYFGESVFSSI